MSANVLFAASLLFSYLAVHIDPTIIALPALFGLAFPYLLLINIIFVLAWIAALRAEALVSIFIIALGVTHFSNYLKIRKSSGDKTGALKVLSYNVHLFNSFEGKKPVSSEKKIFELLKNEQPDIICLQEIFIRGDAGQKEGSFRNSIGPKYYSHMKVSGNGKNRYYGIITLSRYPIINRGDIVHPSSSSLSIYSDIITGRDTFRIYNNHLQSFRLRRMENSLLTELTGGSDNREAINEIRNISLSLRKGFARRAGQAKVLKEHINHSPYPVIVAGDFNDTPVSFSYRKLRKGLNDSFVRSGYGAGFTYKGNYPPNRIDYILYDKVFDCRQFEILKVRHSDHYPVISYLRKAD